VLRPKDNWFLQRAIYNPEGVAPTLRGQQNDPSPRILRWQNKKNGAVLDEITPSLRSSGGTDIRKKPVILHENIGKNISQRDTAVALRQGASHNYQTVYDNFKIRRLTPIECERLQGFPDNWTEGLSDTQRYKCLGNAVTVNVIEFLGHQIRSSLSSVKNGSS